MKRCSYCQAIMTLSPINTAAELAEKAWHHSLSQGWLCPTCKHEGAKIDAGFTARTMEEHPWLAAQFYPHTTEKWFGQDWYEGRTNSPFEVLPVAEVGESLGEESGD